MTLTPEQFNKLVTKDEFNELKSEVSEIKNNTRQILTAIDAIVYELKDINSELTANISAHDRFETRITKLEKVNNL